MGFKFVHAADIHIDSPLRGLDRYEGAPVDRVRGATRRAFKNLVQLTLDEGAAFLLVAGDLYDGDWPDYNTGLFFLAEVRKLGAAGIPVFVVRGNHDAKSKLSASLRLPERVHVFPTARAETRAIEPLGVAIHGRSYPLWNTKEDLSATYPAPLPGYFNIGLLHTSADGRDGHEGYAPCRIDGLIARGYDYWALGHVHAREIVRREPWVVFPGNLQGRHARESGAKGASLVTVEDDRATVEHRVLDDVRWIRCAIDASAAASADDVVDLVRLSLQHEAEGAQERLVGARIVIHGATEAHAALAHDAEKYRQEIRSVGTDLGNVWVEKIQLTTRGRFGLDALMDRDDPVGGLLRSLQKLRGDDVALAAHAKRFEDLMRKLPAEYKEADDALRLDEPATVRGLLEDVEAMLLPELLAGGYE